jgi:hypothetical protein
MLVKNLNFVSCGESVIKGDIVVTENVQKSAYVICSNDDAPGWRTVFDEYTAHSENRKFTYLHCRHTDTNSVQDRMTAFFALENIINK